MFADELDRAANLMLSWKRHRGEYGQDRIEDGVLWSLDAARYRPIFPRYDLAQRVTGIEHCVDVPHVRLPGTHRFSRLSSPAR